MSFRYTAPVLTHEGFYHLMKINIFLRVIFLLGIVKFLPKK